MAQQMPQGPALSLPRSVPVAVRRLRMRRAGEGRQDGQERRKTPGQERRGGQD